MNKTLVALLFTLTFGQLNAMFPRIEEITKDFNPSTVTLHINEEQKALLQEIADSESTQLPGEKLQSFLDASYINFLAGFKDIKKHIIKSPHREHNPERVYKFIDDNKFKMRTIKHVSGIDLLKKITEALVTHEC